MDFSSKALPCNRRLISWFVCRNFWSRNPLNDFGRLVFLFDFKLEVRNDSPVISSIESRTCDFWSTSSDELSDIASSFSEDT